MIREIVKIDEELCDGCGLCVPNCHEGAIRIIDGKARLISDRLCDGLGACLGHCPRGAITIEHREAPAFDEALVEQHLQEQASGLKPVAASIPLTQIGEQHAAPPAHARALHGHNSATSAPHRGGCPGSRLMQFGGNERPAASVAQTTAEAGNGAACSGARATEHIQSELTQWPVQLNLLPPSAPALHGAKVLVAADCVPVAYAGFHANLLRGRKVLIGCPKFDDLEGYTQRLAAMMVQSRPEEIVVARMEVPCCSGISAAVARARHLAGVDIKVTEVVISVQGEVLAERPLAEV